MYHPYVDVETYLKNYTNTSLDEALLYKYLRQSSRDIDVLTFNRILEKGFENLTEYQQEIIREVCLEHTSFLIDNEELLKTYISAYTINGVSMNLGSFNNIYASQGVMMDRSMYQRLCSTGLCCRSIYYG